MIQTKVATVFQGKACPEGHTERYVSSGYCRPCNIARSKAQTKAKQEARKANNDLSFKATVKKVYERSKSW